MSQRARMFSVEQGSKAKPPAKRWVQKKEKVIDLQKEREFHTKAIATHLNNKETWTTFTDGSCIQNPGPAGAAALLVLTHPSPSPSPSPTPSPTPTATTSTALSTLKKEEKVSLPRLEKDGTNGCRYVVKDYVFPGNATNNLAELKGFSLALDILEKQQTKQPRKTWVILTDSDYLQGLFVRGNNAKKNVQEVTDLRERVQQLAAANHVVIQMQWVRAHCGVYWNEKVDQFANAAAKLCQQNRRQPPKKEGTPNPNSDKGRRKAMLTPRPAEANSPSKKRFKS